MPYQPVISHRSLPLLANNPLTWVAHVDSNHRLLACKASHPAPPPPVKRHWSRSAAAAPSIREQSGALVSKARSPNALPSRRASGVALHPCSPALQACPCRVRRLAEVTDQLTRDGKRCTSAPVRQGCRYPARLRRPLLHRHPRHQPRSAARQLRGPPRAKCHHRAEPAAQDAAAEDARPGHRGIRRHQ